MGRCAASPALDRADLVTLGRGDRPVSPLGSSWLPRAGRRLEARSTLTSFSASRRPRVRRRLPNSVFLFPGWRRPRGSPRPSLSSSCVFTPAGTRGSLFPCVTIHHYLRNTLARARPPSPLCPSEPVPASGSRHRWRRLRAGALREGRGGPAEERWQPMLSPGLRKRLAVWTASLLPCPRRGAVGGLGREFAPQLPLPAAQ